MRSILDRYAQGASERLGPGTFCSITLQDGESLLQVGSNDPRAAACDRLETELADGPCIQAMKQLFAVLVTETGHDGRWPAWEAAAAASGFRSMVAMPGYVDDDTTVGLNMYSELTDPWDVTRLIGMDAYVQEMAGTVRAQLGR
jgi:hypothetical protein